MLAPPRRLDQGAERRQLLVTSEPALSDAEASLLGLLCATLGVLPFTPALLFCALALGLGGRGACTPTASSWRWLSWLTLVLAGVGVGFK